MAHRESRQSPEPLLGARLWPLTGAYAFFDAKIDVVAEVLGRWRRGLDLEPVVEPLVGPLEVVLRALQPMSLGYRELLVPTTSAWTAYFSDQRDGADEGPVGQIAELLERRAVLVVWWPLPKYLALRFELFAPHASGSLNVERTVDLGTDDDGRLVFTATGNPQPYEDVDAYRAPRLEDRLTPALIARYCRALGLRPFDDDFFGRDCVLITSRDWRPDIRFTVAQQQARYDFTPSAT